MNSERISPCPRKPSSWRKRHPSLRIALSRYPAARFVGIQHSKAIWTRALCRHSCLPMVDLAASLIREAIGQGIPSRRCRVGYYTLARGVNARGNQVPIAGPNLVQLKLPSFGDHGTDPGSFGHPSYQGNPPPRPAPRRIFFRLPFGLKSAACH